jgi:hypothetical protein
MNQRMPFSPIRDDEERRRRQQEFERRQQQRPAPPPQQQQAPTQQAIPLNRAAGESYDQGQQMTMEDAIRIAAQYGAVPSRISSGAADPNSGYMGVWAIPTAQGWVPLGQGSAPPAGSPTATPRAVPSAPPSAPTSLSDRARGPYGPPASTAPPAPPAMTPRPAQGPPTSQGVYPQPGPQGQGQSLSTPNVNVVVNNTPQPREGEGALDFQRRTASPGVPPAAVPGAAMSAMNNPQYPYSPSWQGDQYGSSAAAEAAFASQRRLDQQPPMSRYPGINTGARLTPPLGMNQTPLNPQSGFGSSLTMPLNRNSGLR